MVDITSQMKTKIRLVRCPRCREVLPELPDIPVYKCGGCGTILEAKNRKNDIKEAVLSSHETNSSQNDEDESVSDSSNQETTLVSESSPGSEFKGDNFEIDYDKQPGTNFSDEHHNFEIDNDKQPGTNFSDEHLSSTELSSHGNERLSPVARESTEQGEHKCPLGEDARKDGNESLNRNGQQPEDGISSDELPNSDDLSFRKKEYSSPEIREPMMQGEDRSSLTENIGKYAKESQDDYSEQTGEKKSSDELHSSAELSRQNIETSSPKVSECIKLNGPEDLSELYPSRDQDERRDCKADKPEGNTFLGIVPLTVEGNHQSELSPGGGAHTQWDGSIYNSEKNNGVSQHEFPGQIEESSQNIEFVRKASSTAPDACHKVETSLVISKTHTDVNKDSVSHFKSSNLEDSLSLEKEDDVLFAAESPLNEGNISENLSADISASHLKMSHVEGSLNPEKGDVLVATESLLNEGNSSENLSPDNSVSHFETSNVEGPLSPEKGDVLVAAESPLNEANLSENLSADISVSHLKMSHVESSLSPEKRDVLVATKSLLNEGNLSENLSPDNSVSHFETSNVEGSLSLEKGDVLVAAESPLNEANLSENLFADISASHLKTSHVEGSLSPEKRDVLVATKSLLNEGNLSENLSPDNSVSHFETSNVEDSLSLEKGDVLAAAESPLNEANLSENLFADVSVSHLKMSHVEGSLSPEKRDVLVATESLLNEGNLSENLSPDNSVSHVETSNVEKGDVLVAAESPLNEANLSEYLSPDEYLEQSQKNVQGFDRVSSGESLVGLPIIPRYTPGAMSKSPTRIYYGDSSVSSYDGNEDQPSDQPSHLYKGKFKATDLLSTHRSRRTDGLRAKKMQDSELEMHHEQIASSSKFPEKNSPAIIGREWIHDELPRPRGQSSSIFAEMNNQAITGREWSHDELPHVRGQSHATRRRMRFDNNDLIPKKPYVSRGSQLVHGNGSPSSYRHNVFHHHSGFNSPDTKSYVEPDKMELLRMVYELEDKLNKTRISERMENGRFSSGVRGYEKHTPTRYDDLATEGNVYADFENFKYHDSFSQGIGWPQRSKVSRMAFSGEGAYGRHQVDRLCSHCSPQDWQWSRQLPSHYSSDSKRQYTVHPGHHRHEAFPSHSSTPQHYTSSEFSSWDQEIKSENQKYKEHEQRRLYLREKYHAAKRHLRPTAGGAPIIACSHCSELLQLPMDFLVLRKRCHQLRCNSCYRILKFSLQKKVHLVPHVPNPSTPPPSEIDDDSGVANSRTLASSHSNHHPPQAEPVSFSEDYDLSFCRSCSTEREPSMVTPASHSHQKNTHKGKMPSGDSYQSMEDRNTNAVSRNSRSTGKNSGEAFESVETSSKMSKWGTSCSEIQEVPPASGSPLHKLMGYSSPSHVLFASPGDESEEETRYRNQHM